MSNRKDKKLQEQQREHLPAAVYEAAVEKAQWHAGSVSLTLWCDRSRTASCQRSDQTYGVYCSVRMRRSADDRKKAEKVPLKVTIKKNIYWKKFSQTSHLTTARSLLSEKCCRQWYVTWPLTAVQICNGRETGEVVAWLWTDNDSTVILSSEPPPTPVFILTSLTQFCYIFSSRQFLASPLPELGRWWWHVTWNVTGTLSRRRPNQQQSNICCASVFVNIYPLYLSARR